MTTCYTCGAELVTGKGGRRYCRPCRRATSRAAANPDAPSFNTTHCINGHEYTPENTSIRRGGGRHCRACNRDKRNRTYARLRRNARAAELRRLKTQARRKEAEEWFDWVVVYRVVSRGGKKPGRAPTVAEWREIFARLADETSEEIARRTGICSTTVSRYRNKLAEGQHVAA